VSAENSGEDLGATLQEFLSGQKLFNRYTLVKTLGRGGMGVVWLARDDELERDVALKFLPDLIVRDRAVLSDMKRETRRSLELTHKNIVRIHDFVYDEKSGCISMEYIDGDTLSNLRVDKPTKAFEPSELADWTSQLCDALDYAHNHARIIHRDLKPSNLMVNQRCDLKVADFGIARSLNESVSVLTMQRGRSGTLLYMSPQQLDGERGSPLDDIYSLGATLYELITSKPPFYFGNIDRQIHEKAPERMTDRRRELEIEGRPIAGVWEDAIRACLAKDPAQRPQSVREVAERLAIEPPRTRRAPGRAPLATGKPKSRASLLGAIGVVAAVVAAAAWYFGFFAKAPKNQPVVTAPPATHEAKPAENTPAPREIPALLSAPLPSVSSNPVAAASPPSIREQSALVTETSTLSKSYVKPNSFYTGTIRVKVDSSVAVPLAIAIGPDLKSGTMTQSGRRGDLIVKFTGVWDGPLLHAVTDQVISTPPGIKWQPESFTVRFADDGRSGSYECFADGKTYVADLALLSGIAATTGATYKGAIQGQGETGPGTPLIISFGADRKSGTMTQASKSGDTVVRFNGIWDGDTLRAVTNEVITKPKNIQWKPESFTVRVTEDGKHASYQCESEGRLYKAELTPP
jgi:serine/threonine protein kinase